MSQKQKKIVVTPQEVANLPTRKSKQASKTILEVEAVQPQPTVALEAASQDQVTFIQVNELDEVSAIEAGSLLGNQDEITIQITNEQDEETQLTQLAEDEDQSNYLIQPPDSYRRELLEIIEDNLYKRSEKYADLAIFCSDGIVWTSKLVLASASAFVKELLLSVPSMDDTCLVVPNMTKVEFLTFQSALFSKDDTQPSDMYSVIKGCQVLGIDLEDQIDFVSNAEDEPPLVEYSSMLANPFEKKRMLKNLGYISLEGEFCETNAIKDVAPVMQVLESEVRCHDCNRNFFDTDSLERHQKSVHSSYTIDKLVKNQDKYSCPVCLRAFGYAVNLKKHFWFCHSTTGAQIRMKSAVSMLPLSVPLPSKHERLVEKFEDMTCSICGKVCKNWKYLEIHMLGHTKKNPFKCDTCGRGFKDDQKLKRHQVVHTKEKNFACPFCGKKFGLKHNMMVHARNHKGGQNRKCDYCTRTFPGLAPLKNHMLIHKEKKHIKTDDPEVKLAQVIKVQRGRPSIHNSSGNNK